MVDDGHFSEMVEILNVLPKKDGVEKKRQTFVCSATISVARQLLKKSKGMPKTSFEKMVKAVEFQRPLEIVDLTSTADNIETLSKKEGGHSVLVRKEKVRVASTITVEKILCLPDEKDTYLYYLLHIMKDQKVLVFVNAISSLRRLRSILELLKIKVFPLHSNMQQRQRLKNMDRFREADSAVLVATDVAARGIDVPDVDGVIHFQIPRDLKTYVHRTGRCGRAGQQGWSCLMVSPQEQVRRTLCTSWVPLSLCRSPSSWKFRSLLESSLTLMLTNLFYPILVLVFALLFK
mmetsp:Transcript_30797/g.80655  ORF Transcript_30797/g.80655 Transcript_30797/m.80655 type:complete len:291 (-) Transcript_30797:685-1557(-)